MTNKTILLLLIFISALFAGSLVGNIFLENKVKSLTLQLTQKASFFVRYATIKEIDLVGKTLLFSYRSAFDDPDIIIRGKLNSFTIIQEQNPIYADGVIVRLSRPKNIKLEDLKIGDKVFVRIETKATNEIIYMKRGIPLLP